MIKHYDTQAPSGGGGGEKEPEGFYKWITDKIKQLRGIKRTDYGDARYESFLECLEQYEFWGHLTQKKEPVLPRWVKASDRLPLHKAHWITKKYGAHDNDFPVRMNGRYSMGNIFDESPKEAIGHAYMLQFEGTDHYEYEFPEIEWLEEAESIPSSLPDGEVKDKNTVNAKS